MHKSKLKQISLAVCLALMPFSGFAAGLGKLNVTSGLGEPLKAEIELLSVSAEELSTLVAGIASEEAYATQGITRLGIHNSIKVEVAKAGDGSPILKLRSSQPISDPYLDMLIQVDWASGRLQREYTVLLDPPGYKQATESAAPMMVTPPSIGKTGNAMPAPIVDSRQSVSNKSKKSKKHINPVAPTNTPSPQASAEGSTESTETTGDQTITTKRGDTLSSIAKQAQVEGVNLDQMLVGLYESNKEAFTSGNMNRLKVGQIIKVPTKDNLTSINAKQAAKSVKVHSSNWNAYRNTLAGAVVSSTAMETNEQKQTSSGKVETAEDKAAPAKVGPQDVVKLSAGEKGTGKAGNDASKVSEAKIVALQEETTARAKALKEAQDRAAALETQIEDMKKLLALKSQSMATAQKNAETAAKLPDVKAEPKPEEKAIEKPAVSPAVSPPDTKKTEATPPVAVNPGDTNAVAATTVDKNDTDKTTAPVVAANNLPPVVKKVAPPQAEPVKEPSFLEGIINAVDLTVLGAIGGVALLGAGWMFLRNKRRKDLDSFERGILTSGGLRANTVFGNTTGNASNSDTSFLTDFAQSADGSMIDTNDVDPIAEAEVYMAYGRDAQAEEILKDAISKEPKRYELHIKLLEMYATRKDTSAFEAIAGELYTTLGVNDPVWVKVAEIGHNMEPENPLYDVSKSATISSIPSQSLDISDFTKVPDNTDLDFSLDNDAALEGGVVHDDANSIITHSFSVPQNLEQETSFDLGSVEETHLAALNNPVTDNTVNFNSDTDSSIDFDLGEFNMDATPADSPLDKAVTITHDFTAPEFNLSSVDSLPVTEPTLNDAEDNNTLDFDMDFSAFTPPKLDELPDSLDKSAGTTPSAVNDKYIANDIVFDFDLPSEEPVTAIDSERSFDLPSFDSATDDPLRGESAPVIAQPNEFEANTFDLSSISLDLGDSATELSNTEASAIESPDVDIKLDLVAAYIDMDDKEGAKELLDEVMKEGGAKQQLRAQKMLASLA